MPRMVYYVPTYNTILSGYLRTYAYYIILGDHRHIVYAYKSFEQLYGDNKIK